MGEFITCVGLELIPPSGYWDLEAKADGKVSSAAEHGALD